jgi:O-antigen/teichoic acid export membrane protein
LLVPLIIVAVRQHGIEGAAMSRAVVAVVILPLMLFLTSRASPLRFRDLAAALGRPLAAGLLMTLCLQVPLAYPGGLFLVLAAKVALGMTIYISALTALWLIAGRPDGIEAAILQRARIATKSAPR